MSESPNEPALHAASSDAAFYVADGAEFVATAYTSGPWDPGYQHGGPPAALMLGEMSACVDGSSYALAKLTVELFRPVPVARVRVSAEVVHAGRQVQRVRATLSHEGRVLGEGRAIFIRRAHVPSSDLPAAPWPAPGTLEPLRFPFFKQALAYHSAVELRVAQGAWGERPIGMWARLLVPVVAGRENAPEQDVVALADAQSGMSPPLDIDAFTFLNPELTLYFERPAHAGAFGFDIRSVSGGSGVGVAQSEIRDAAGVFARSAQSMVIAPR